MDILSVGGGGGGANSDEGTTTRSFFQILFLRYAFSSVPLPRCTADNHTENTNFGSVHDPTYLWKIQWSSYCRVHSCRFGTKLIVQILKDYSGCPFCAKQVNTGCPSCGKLADTGCPNCGKLANTGCPNCGKLANTGCPNCGKLANTGCPNCGKLPDSGLTRRTGLDVPFVTNLLIILQDAFTSECACPICGKSN